MFIIPGGIHAEPRDEQEVVPATPPELLRNDDVPIETCPLEQGYNLDCVVSNLHVNDQLSIISHTLYWCIGPNQSHPYGNQDRGDSTTEPGVPATHTQQNGEGHLLQDANHVGL